MSLRVVPVSFAQACAFITDWHRHHRPPQGHKFSLGVADGEILVGVAVVGRPVARMLDDGQTLEVTRVAVADATPNACSLLYAAAWRAAKALGYRRLVTYTQANPGPVSGLPGGASSPPGRQPPAGPDRAGPAPTTASSTPPGCAGRPRPEPHGTGYRAGRFRQYAPANGHAVSVRHPDVAAREPQSRRVRAGQTPRDCPAPAAHLSAVSRRESVMSTSTDPILAPPIAAGATGVLDPHAEIRRLTEQLAALTTAHDALRAGIYHELTTLVARRWVRSRDADDILTRFGLPKLARRFAVGADVPVTVTLCAPDERYAARGARRLIIDDLRRLRDARPQPRPIRDVLDTVDDTIQITKVVALDAEDTARRPRLRVAATVSLAVTVDSRRANTVWTAARPRLQADLARLRLIHADTNHITKTWINEVGLSVRRPS